MDKLNLYRDLIKRLLINYNELLNRRPLPGQETELVFDEEHDNYMLVAIGWWQRRRVRRTTLFVRLRNGKIWIEEDSLEDGLAADLLREGVPKEDIVLAFHPPEMRPLTEFAVA
ncbi:MAG: hypothetical protein BroJett015_26010 [Chloroflexota bacterium]|nr:XisI protein [Ardenticatenaceae bacterium]GIK56938.1 MAG: hypothetical protein BroJett015_26010 [Chloroflexota bacterium]